MDIRFDDKPDVTGLGRLIVKGERLGEPKDYFYGLPVAVVKHIATLTLDGERYRRILAIRGEHVGIPCACEFADDEETLTRICEAHKAWKGTKDQQ